MAARRAPGAVTDRPAAAQPSATAGDRDRARSVRCASGEGPPLKASPAPVVSDHGSCAVRPGPLLGHAPVRGSAPLLAETLITARARRPARLSSWRRRPGLLQRPDGQGPRDPLPPPSRGGHEVRHQERSARREGARRSGVFERMVTARQALRAISSARIAAAYGCSSWGQRTTDAPRIRPGAPHDVGGRECVFPVRAGRQTVMALSAASDAR